ncbi:hypothetical protein 1 [Hubei picorna-like virus 5]|uniref:hypothetical protein 1 n=1 Tax=Hubei picorna-like virus 5 TaxID=1923131 RepID=UPI00090C0455|nr:hypothetical protein 1 [Hubei picorna-like virus 5]APG78392.1 hypothetical protein 1 [Hubei picorna-like virus 5]
MTVMVDGLRCIFGFPIQQETPLNHYLGDILRVRQLDRQLSFDKAIGTRKAPDNMKSMLTMRKDALTVWKDNKTPQDSVTMNNITNTESHTTRACEEHTQYMLTIDAINMELHNLKNQKCKKPSDVYRKLRNIYKLNKHKKAIIKQQCEIVRTTVVNVKQASRLLNNKIYVGDIGICQNVFFAYTGPMRCETVDLTRTLAENIASLHLPSLEEHYYFWNTKPIRPNVKLEEYNLSPNATIHILPLMRGGVEVPLPLYTHVQECERQVLAERYTLQSDFFKGGMSVTQVYDKFTELRDSIEAKTDSKVIDIFDRIFQLFYWSRKCESYLDYTMLASLGFSLMTGRTPSKCIFGLLETEQDRTDVLQGQFGDFVKMARNLFDMGASLTSNPLVEKITKVYTYLLVQGFLESTGVSLSEEEYLVLYKKSKVNYKDSTSLAICMVDLAITICERIEAYRLTGDWMTLVHTDAAYTKWAAEADKLIALAPFTSNLEPHNTTYFSFISDLNECIEKGDAMSKFTRSGTGIDPSFIGKRLNNMKMLKNLEITKRSAQKERKAPFGVLIHGGSSVAKSTFTKMVYYYYGKIHGLKTDDHYRYVRNPTDEYWSNFDSSKWCVQLDDIAFLLPTKSSEVDPTLKEMLNVINNVPYVPPQAAIEDKGRTPVMAKLVLATTNAPDLNAQEYFHCPLAVRRRLPYVVQVEPRPEYLAENNKFIDPSKLPEMTGESFPDYWRITLQRLEPKEFKGRDTAALVPVKVFDNVIEFLEHFGAASREHELYQTKSSLCDRKMDEVKVCRLCMKIGDGCKCLQAAPIVGLTSMMWNYSYSYLWYFFTGLLVSIYMYLFQTGLNIYLLRYYSWRFITGYLSQYLDKERQIKCFTIMNGRVVQSSFSIRLRTVVKGAQWIMSILIVVQAAKFVTKSVKKTVSVKEQSKEKSDQDETDDHHLSTQGNTFGTTENDLLRENTSNVWYTPTLELTRFDLPDASGSMSKKTPEEMRDYVSNNCVNLCIEALDEPFRANVCGFYVGAQNLIFNHHAIRMGTRFRLKVISAVASQGIGGNATMEFDKKDCRINLNKDLVLLRTVGLPPRKNIQKIWNIKNVPVSEMISVRREKSGEVVYRRHFNVSYEPKFPVEALGQEIDMYMTTSSHLSNKGDCGSVAIAMTPCGPTILGLHTIGYNSRCGFTHITKSDIDELTSNTPQVYASEAPKFSLDGEVKLTIPDNKSVLRYIEEGTAYIYGRVPGFRPKRASKVTTTPLSERMCEYFSHTISHGQPQMKGWVPWRKNIIEMIKPNLTHNQSTLNKCVTSFTKDIIQGLKLAHGEDWKKDLVFLSKRASLNGIPGVKFVDAINKNTSMGFPWNKSKKNFLKSAPCESYPDGVDFDEDIWEEFDRIIDRYQNNQRVNTIFSGNLKDEALPFAKCEEGKTRLFTGAPAPWSLVVRSRLLSFVRLLQQNKFIFEAGPGTVAQSSEWSHIRKYLTAFGADRIVAGDYSKFDKRMTAPWILAAFEIIINIYREAGFDNSELGELWCIAYDIAFPMVNCDGDIIGFFGTNPSGHPLTVVINSLVNSLYMRYAYCEIVGGGDCDDFQKYVRLFTYGDDNIMGVSPSVDFSHTRIQEALARIGVTYTMADKEAETKPFINITETSFLKRQWRYEEELNLYTCPLETESILKSLTVWLPSKTICKEEQMVAVISSANSEFFFHGKEIFEKHHAFFKKTLAIEPYSCFVQENTLPDWDALKYRFVEAYKGGSPSLAVRELAFLDSEKTTVT